MWWCSWRGSYRNGGTLPSWPWYERSTPRGRLAAPAQLRAKGTGNRVKNCRQHQDFERSEGFYRVFLWFLWFSEGSTWVRSHRWYHHKGTANRVRNAANIKILKDLRGFIMFSCCFFGFLRGSCEWGAVVGTNTKAQKMGSKLSANTKVLKDLRGFIMFSCGFSGFLVVFPGFLRVSCEWGAIVGTTTKG